MNKEDEENLEQLKLKLAAQNIRNAVRELNSALRIAQTLKLDVSINDSVLLSNSITDSSELYVSQIFLPVNY